MARGSHRAVKVEDRGIGEEHAVTSEPAPQPGGLEPGRSPERRLAVIAVADIVGYSRLMAVDDRLTLARWVHVRTHAIEPAVARHHGKIIKTIGDGLILEFHSALDAVQCACAIQTALA